MHTTQLKGLKLSHAGISPIEKKDTQRKASPIIMSIY